MTFAQSVHGKAIELTRKVVAMTTAAGSGHPSSASSLAHVVTVLLYDRMQYEPMQPDHPAADRLILSEGHACPIVYAAGADLGFAIDTPDGRRAMTDDDLQHLREIGSPLDGHPNPHSGFPFFATATGSLGQGLSMAAGLAAAARLDGIDRRVYCIVGDGESREGQVWEALDLLIDLDLRAVCPIFNCNGMGQTGAVSEQQSPSRLRQKLQAFGFDAREVDGHDPDALRAAFAAHAAQQDDGPPVAVVARTTKGWGTNALHGDMHGKPLSEDKAKAAMQDLDRLAASLHADASAAGLREREELPKVPAVARALPPRPAVGHVPHFDDALTSLHLESLRDETALATRKAHGIALQMLGRLRSDVVVLDGDVGNSTYTDMFAHDERLRGRFLQCRIAEQNMVSCAVGLAVAGMVPFVASFGKFLVRGYDQLEMAMISGANLKLVGSHVGVTPAPDGPSQMALADVAFCRSLGSVLGPDGAPLLYVLTPCDARSAYGLTMAMAAHAGSCYLRTQRPAVPHLYATGAEFAPGGMNVLQEGEQLAILANGYLVHEAARAVRTLQDGGIDAALVDAYSLPFDRDRLLAIASRSGNRLLTVEDNYGGGLGSAVAEVVAATGSGTVVRSLTVRRLPSSARDPGELLARLELSADHVVAQARQLLGRA